MIEIRLPFPPSCNAMYGNNKTGRGKGRYDMAILSAWKHDAGYLLKAQRPKKMKERCIVTIDLDDRRQGDAANREKAVTDLLVTHGIIPGDQKKWVRGVFPKWEKVNECVVKIFEDARCTIQIIEGIE